MKKTATVTGIIFVLFFSATAGFGDTLFIPHTAFQPETDNSDYKKDNDYLRNYSSVSDVFYAPVYLPQGAVVDGVFLFFEDQNTDNIDCYLVRKNPDSGIYKQQFPISTTGAVSGIRYAANWKVTTGTRTINHNVFSYYIELALPEAPDYKVYGVRVHYH